MFFERLNRKSQTSLLGIIILILLVITSGCKYAPYHMELYSLINGNPVDSWTKSPNGLGYFKINDIEIRLSMMATSSRDGRKMRGPYNLHITFFDRGLRFKSVKINRIEMKSTFSKVYEFNQLAIERPTKFLVPDRVHVLLKNNPYAAVAYISFAKNFHLDHKGGEKLIIKMCFTLYGENLTESHEIEATFAPELREGIFELYG